MEEGSFLRFGGSVGVGGGGGGSGFRREAAGEGG